MDETKTGEQGVPQSEAGLPSAAKEGSTSSQTKTYTEEEYRKAISDEKAQAGRLTKSLKEYQTKAQTLEKQIEDLSSRLETYDNRQQEADLERVKGDPALFKLHQEKAQMARQLKEANRQLRETADLRATLEAHQKEQVETKKNTLLASLEGKVTADRFEKLKNMDVGVLEVIAETVSQEQGNVQSSDFKPDSAMGRGAVTRVGDLPPKERVKESERRLAVTK